MTFELNFDLVSVISPIWGNYWAEVFGVISQKGLGKKCSNSETRRQDATFEIPINH